MAYSHSSLIQVRVIGFRMLWVYGKAKQPARQLQAPLLPAVRSKLISNPEPPPPVKRQGLILEASKAGTKVGRMKDPLYKDSYLGITPPTFILPFEAPDHKNKQHQRPQTKRLGPKSKTSSI